MASEIGGVTPHWRCGCEGCDDMLNRVKERERKSMCESDKGTAIFNTEGDKWDIALSCSEINGTQ